MILDSTGKRIRAFMAGAPAATQPEWYAAWADHDDIGPPPTFIPADDNGSLNGATAVELIPPPAGAQQRQAKYISIFNADSATVVVTVELWDGASTRLARAELLTLERLVWEDDVGWQVFNASGLPSPGIVSPLTTKGDIWGFDTADNRIPVGADGEVLLADSAAGLGVSWQAPPVHVLIVTAVLAAASPYSPAADDDVLIVDATGGVTVIALPAAASSDGRILQVKKVDATANAVSIDGNGGELVDGALTFDLLVQYESATVVCDGTQWWVV